MTQLFRPLSSFKPSINILSAFWSTLESSFRKHSFCWQTVWTKAKMERTRCVFKQKCIGVDRAWMLALALASLRPILSLAPYLHSWWICICLHVGMSQWVEFNSCNLRKGNVQAFMATELLFLVKRIGELCVLSVGLILSLLLFHLPLFFGFLLHVFADN